jgi:opacity protein-like surface antigen
MRSLMAERSLRHPFRITAIAAVMGLLSAAHSFAQSEQPQVAAAPAASAAPRIGIQGFGLTGLDWPIAKESFEATALDKRPAEFGGGARVTNLWRALFVQVQATRWSSTGERVFVDSSGTSFPLGIPLEVKATHVDVTGGWRFFPRNNTNARAPVPYLGGGVGVAKYREESPFAEPGDDLDTSATSYHALAGVDVPLRSWLAIAADIRYRYVPDLLGDDGASSAFDEEDFGGVQLALGLRIGFGGAAPVRPRRAEPEPEPIQTPELNKPATTPSANTRSGVLTIAAPVYLLPDATRTPLRVVEAGTAVNILEEVEGWYRIEFRDPQFGSRVGYVQSKFVRR